MINVYCGKAPEWLSDAFLSEGVKLNGIGTCDALQAPVQGHIDMMALMTPDMKNVFVSKQTENLVKPHVSASIKVIASDLSAKYPGDVLLNAVLTDKYLICNKKYVAPELLEYALMNRVEVINVKQGYAKCSTVVLPDNVFITEDESIYDALTAKGLDVLKIEKGHVSLPGYSYGFIGGASAYFNDTLYFFGNIENHPSFKAIEAFLTSHNINWTQLSDKEQLIDIGGILEL